MINQLSKGQFFELTRSIKYNDTKIELSMKAEIMAVGENESLVLVDDIHKEEKVNVYIPNDLITPKLKEVH